MNVALVSGATGFVGRRLVADLQARGTTVIAAVRRPAAVRSPVRAVVVPELDGTTEWARHLEGVDTVFHLAAHVHRIGTTAGDRDRFRAVNVEGTERLAQAAHSAGVRRFVFVSTVKVHGDSSDERPLVEGDPARPADAYARSKWEAEQRLHEVSGAMTTTILRPPLVYGEGVGANFLRLMETIDRGVPLPFGAVHNRRSLIYVGNLSSALIRAAESAEGGRTFLVSDGRDLSTPELLRLVAGAMGRPARLFAVPPAVLSAIAAIAGRREAAARLLGSLAVDISAISSTLGWKPRFSVEEGLRATVEAWRKARS